MGLDKVEKQVDSFIGSKAFWYALAFIGLTMLFLWLTKPDMIEVDYLGYDDDGNPVDWNTGQ